MSSPRLLEASFVLAHVNHRALVVPTSPNLATPDGRTWQEVTDAVLAEVPSKMLFALVGTQLQRDLKSYAIGRHGRWVFDRTLECDIKSPNRSQNAVSLDSKRCFCQRALSCVVSTF